MRHFLYRLDKFLVMKGYFPSREKAQTAIKDGNVFVDGKARDCAFALTGEEQIEVKNVSRYVSRGAYKLLGAKSEFNLDFNDRVVLDIGASTGGFTQVALESGAKKVYAVDVGTNQLSDQLKNDDRVVDLSQTDFRIAPKFEDVDFIVSDLSFISLRYVIPKIVEQYKGIEMVLLFKPQFECGVAIAKRGGGVVRDSKLHTHLLEDFINYLTFFNFKVSNITHSPITGKTGNIEYLLHLNGKTNKKVNTKKVVQTAFSKL